MAVTGDFVRLAMLKETLRRAAQGEARKAMLGELADETKRQVLDGFAQKRDPYGQPWAPRKKPTGWAAMAFGALEDGHPLLDKTGALIRSIRARATSTGVVVTAVGYAAFHQEGTRKMVARRIVPTQSLGLGPIWTTAYLRASGRVMRSFARAA